MSQQRSVLEKFQDDFKNVVFLCAVLSDDVAFKEKHGFSQTEYVQNRRDCAESLRSIADHIEKVTRDVGIAKTTGGSTAIVSGAAVIGGILAAPFTAGASLALTFGGIAGGVASTATSVTAGIVKHQSVKNASEEVKKILDELEEKDEAVNKIVEELQSRMASMRSAYKSKTVVDWLDSIKRDAMWAKGIGMDVGYRGYQAYSSIKVARFAKRIADFIQADVYVMQGIAEGMSAPGLSLFGKTLVAAGGTAAKVLSGSMALLGIGFGIWDIVDGVSDINGSTHAEAYRDAATKITEQTTQFENLRKEIAKMAQSNRE